MTSNKPYSRSERVGKQILEIISSIAIKNIDLSPLGFITFTNVDVSPDLKNAKIFYSAYKKKVSDDALYKALNNKNKKLLRNSWVQNYILDQYQKSIFIVMINLIIYKK